MGNPTNAFDFDVSLATFLAAPISDGSNADLLVTLKVDEIGQGAVATKIAEAGGQLWSNVLDDYVQATYPSFHLATKVWRVANESALVAIGTDNSLAVDDIGYTSDDHQLWYATSVSGPNSSTWALLPVRVPFLWAAVASDTLGSPSIDNYTPPAPWPSVHVLRLTPDTGGSTITGLVAGEPGQVVRVCNIDASDTVTFSHEDGSSDADARILNSNNSDLIIRPNGCVSLWYDIVSERWRTG